MTCRRATTPLDRLNEADRSVFVDLVGPLVEQAPWVAEAAFDVRPFETPDALWRALFGIIITEPAPRKMAFLRGHPELGGHEARIRTMTDESTREQDALQLAALNSAEATRLADLNRRYREHFGYPCVIAVRLHASLASLLDAFEARLNNPPDMELDLALDQVGEVIRGRIETMFSQEFVA